MKNTTHIYPLGSECYLNHGIDLSMLKQNKIYKSPFNGTRLIGSIYPNPIMMFFNNRNEFIDIYSDRNNWKIIPDGKDIQSYNYLLNLRRCHCKTNEFEFIEKSIESIATYEKYKDDCLLVCDINDYFIYDENKLKQMMEVLSSRNVMVIMRDYMLKSSIDSISQKTGFIENVTVNTDEFAKRYNIIKLKRIIDNDFVNYSLLFNEMVKRT